jgi:hypothetical protein
MHIEVRPHMCVEIRGMENVNSPCSVAFMNNVGVVAGVQRQILALSIGLNWAGST